jgi:small nuclear ribonucleoprotein (snRNP)-like protein
MPKNNNDNNDDQLKSQFRQFKDKQIIVRMKNQDEIEGKLISIDNYFNVVLEMDEGIQFIKGRLISLIAINE